MYSIVEKLDEVKIEQLMDLYKQCWWAKDRKVDASI